MEIGLQKELYQIIAEKKLLPDNQLKRLHLLTEYGYSWKEGDNLLEFSMDSEGYRQDSKVNLYINNAHKTRITRLEQGIGRIKFTGEDANIKANDFYSIIQQEVSSGSIMRESQYNGYNLEIGLYNTLNNVSKFVYTIDKTERQGYITAFLFKYQMIKYTDLVADTLTNIDIDIRANGN